MLAMARFLLINGVKKFITKYGRPALAKVREFIQNNPKKVEGIRPNKSVSQKPFDSTALGEAAKAAKKYVSPNYSYKKLPFLRGRTKGTDISKGM
tara:strand:- start:82 stop:366 length:285 start_codon:yes stop_codon:yes gene_type:complete